MTEHIFVYGTLLPQLVPEAMQAHVEQLRCVGRARVRGRLYDFGSYPGAVLDASATTEIFGQVLQLPEDADLLPVFDDYEEVASASPLNSLFRRTQTIARLVDNGAEIDCWIYVYNGDVGNTPLIASGDYAKHVAGPKSHSDRLPKP